MAKAIVSSQTGNPHSRCSRRKSGDGAPAARKSPRNESVTPVNARAGDARRRLAAVGESPARMVSMIVLKNREEVVDFGCELGCAGGTVHARRAVPPAVPGQAGPSALSGTQP